MTRREALQVVSKELDKKSKCSDDLASVIITLLDEALHFDTEVVERSATLVRVPTSSLM